MKNSIIIFVLATFCSISFASDSLKINTYPRLTVWQHGLDLNIRNFNPYNVRCSGFINIRHFSGRFSSEYFSGNVFAHSVLRRYIPNRFYNDPITFARHSIRCF